MALAAPSLLPLARGRSGAGDGREEDANDNIGFQLRRLNADIIDIEKFVAEIERKGGETYQYYFGTRKALKYLKNL